MATAWRSSWHLRLTRGGLAAPSFTTPGGARWLLVNGFGMTSLTPITKFISHLPPAPLPDGTVPVASAAASP